MVTCLFLGMLALAVLPQEGAEEEIRLFLEEARTFQEQGEYRKAEKAYQEFLEDGPHPDFLLGLGQVHIQTGRYAKAEKILRGVLDFPEKADQGHFWLAEALRAQGEYADALSSYGQATKGQLTMVAGERQASLLWEMGKREQAGKEWKAIAEKAAKTLIKDPASLVALGRAYERLNRLRWASEVYVEALEQNPGDAAACQALGDLYFRVYGDTEGAGPSPKKKYQEGLKKNPRAVEINLSLHELYRNNFSRDQSKTQEFLSQALRTNPRSVRGLLFQADSLIKNRRFADARKVVKKALEVNPSKLRTKSYQATLEYLENQTEPFAALEKEILAVDPAFGELYAILGSFLRDLYRFEDAIPWLEKAVKLDPGLTTAYTDLGHVLVNAGREKEGIAALEQAEEKEKGFVHPWRKNMLQVLETLHDDYVVIEDAPFRHYFHPEDAEVLREYLLPLYQEAWRVLSEKYGYTPEGPMLVQHYRFWEDFSTRTIGFAGFGALGACFGPVITAVSPSSPALRQSNRFNYLGTAWHEFTHVITLRLSKARIPRWLTEGLSTYEEVLRNPSYTRGMDLDLLQAHANDEVFPLIELNSAFRGSRIIFGYYQGGLICEYLAREYSFSRLVKMVRLYGEDWATSDIFQECFGITPEEFDRRFHDFVLEKLADVKVMPAFGPKKMAEFANRLKRDPEDYEAARLLAWGYFRQRNFVDAEIFLRKLFELQPEDAMGQLLAGELALQRGRQDIARKRYEQGFAAGGEEFFCRMHYARILEGEGEFEAAKEAYRKAKKAFPRYKIPDQSPHLALRQLLAGEGKMEEAMAELEAFVALDAALWRERLELANWYTEKKDFLKADKYFAEANGVEPFSRDLHVRWAKMLREAGKWESSIREWRIARKVRPEMEWQPIQGGSPEKEIQDRAELFYEEALIHKLAGNPEEALRQARETLRLIGDHPEASKLVGELEGQGK